MVSSWASEQGGTWERASLQPIAVFERASLQPIAETDSVFEETRGCAGFGILGSKMSFHFQLDSTIHKEMGVEQMNKPIFVSFEHEEISDMNCPTLFAPLSPLSDGVRGLCEQADGK